MGSLLGNIQNYGNIPVKMLQVSIDSSDVKYASQVPLSYTGLSHICHLLYGATDMPQMKHNRTAETIFTAYRTSIFSYVQDILIFLDQKLMISTTETPTTSYCWSELGQQSYPK
jgi:hypothetical protein